jgi:hypothetical protein
MKLGVSNTIPNIVNLPGQGGLPPIPGFSTKALEFDGTDDYVGCGASATLQPTGAFTVSGWIYIDDLANNNVILANNTSVGANGYVLWITAATTNAIFTVYTGAAYGWVAVQGTTNFVTGQWYHVAGTYAGTSADMNIYVNGQLENTVTSSPATIAYGTEGYIGKYNVGRTEGKIDEVALFGSVLGAPVIDSIFNSGVPTDLTSLNPIAWWRCGENAIYKSPQILMPENNNIGKVSNYSTNFEGLNESVLTSPTYSALDSSSDWAYSFWIKFDDLTVNRNIFGISNGIGGGSAFVQCFWNAATSRLQMYFDGLSYYCRTDAALWTPVTGTWYHVLVTRDGTQPIGSKVTWWIDGNDCSLNESMTVLPSTIATSGINIGDNDGLSNNPFAGNMDDFAIWPQDMGAYKSDIYNGGEPGDLTNLPIGPSPDVWYKMGDESTFSLVWTIPNQIDPTTNNGTSTNMDIYTRTGDASSSENNALSYNMDAADIVPR